MKHIKPFNESTKMNQQEGKNIITKDNKVSIICYQIPNSNDIILSRTNDKKWIVKTTDGIVFHNTNDMEEIYNLDLIESDLEKLGWKLVIIT